MLRKNLLFFSLIVSFALFNCISYAEDIASPEKTLADYSVPLNIDDLTKDNMINLKINFLGTLAHGSALAMRFTINFDEFVYEIVPIYGYIGDNVYLPHNTNIYKLPITAFSKIEPIGDDYNILSAYKAGTHLTDESRANNINILTKTFSKIVIEPEATFDFKSISGNFTPDKGYEEALVSNNGFIYYDYGGGAEQISSTIYASIINNPNIEITERSPCNPSVLILPDNMDACVFDDYNLKFINHYPYSIQIEIISINNESLVLIKKCHP